MRRVHGQRGQQIGFDPADDAMIVRMLTLRCVCGRAGILATLLQVVISLWMKPNS
jgi:hypothetical protein